MHDIIVSSLVLGSMWGPEYLEKGTKIAFVSHDKRSRCTTGS